VHDDVAETTNAVPPIAFCSATDAEPTVGVPRHCADDAQAVVPVAGTAGSSRYVSKGVIGRGGWGVVERADDRQLEREVAIKRLRPTAEHRSEIQRRFFHEAQITSQLQHPGVVPVHELGRGTGGEAFYVMKLLEGKSLREHIREAHSRSPVPPQTTAQLREICLPLLERFIDVCQTVAYAHRQGIIHRDLKPANVMVGEFGETVVVDWGLAKPFADNESRQGKPAADESAQPFATAARATAPRAADPWAAATASPGAANHLSGSSSAAGDYPLTQQGAVVGTPAYMSPEQAVGERECLGPASDIYSLGVLLFEIVAGQTPSRGLDVDTILSRVQAGVLPRLRNFQGSAPRALEAICATAMEHSPGARYGSAVQLADDVRQWIAGDAVSVFRDPAPERLLRWCRHHQSFTIASVAATTVLLVASMLFGVVIHNAHRAEQRARQASEAAHRETLQRVAEAHASTNELLLDVSEALQAYPGTESLRKALHIRAQKTQRSLALQP